jgi:hypothetical protein
MFLFDGSKIGLSIVLCSLEKIKCTVDFEKVFGEQFCKVMNENKEEIEKLNAKI